jgi:hypothetical protein
MDCPSVTPDAKRQEVAEEQKICMRDFTIRTFHLLLLLTNKCTMHGTHSRFPLTIITVITCKQQEDITNATGYITTEEI